MVKRLQVEPLIYPFC